MNSNKLKYPYGRRHSAPRKKGPMAVRVVDHPLEAHRKRQIQSHRQIELYCRMALAFTWLVGLFIVWTLGTYILTPVQYGTVAVGCVVMAVLQLVFIWRLYKHG